MSRPTGYFQPGEYFKPVTVEEAVGLLSRFGDAAWPIAGGTDVMVEKNASIRVLVDVTGLGLEYIAPDERGISIGAATTIADVAASSLLQRGPYQILSKAAQELGTPQIRNMATLGGNLCRPSPASDCAPPLLVLDARLSVVGTRGKREIPIHQFFRGVNQDALQQGEILTEIRLPSLPERTGTAFLKKGRVAVADLSIVSVAVCVTSNRGEVCGDARIALGSVAPFPTRAKKAEELLRGRAVTKNLLRTVAQQASEEIRPITDLRASAEYRKTLSQVLVEQALQEALDKIA
jgi:CO/xanthine dehydrogenase FAD-binding subunit